nr:hypothetical protein [Tanacetum cinerariifolium]
MRILMRMCMMRMRVWERMMRERSDDEDRGLDDEGHGFEGDGLGLKEEEEVLPEGQQQTVLVVDTTTSGPLGLGYEALRRCELSPGEDQVPRTFKVDLEDDKVYTDFLIYPSVAPVQILPSHEWSSVSLPISPSSPIVPSPIASLVATLTATISVDEDQFLEIGAQLELHMSILRNHTQRLDALSPTLIADIDRDMRDLYTRSEVVIVEIFSQRMERRQESKEE